MNFIKQWIEDFHWARLAMRVRRLRRKYGKPDHLFTFDDSLRPWRSGGGRLRYPDAFYHLTPRDFIRAARDTELVDPRDDFGRAA